MDSATIHGDTATGRLWTYDDAGRLTQTTSGDGTTSYGYDVTNQLTAADHSYQTDESYAYDVNGNRTNTGYTTGDDNRLTADGTHTYLYDNQGNRTRKTTTATGEYVASLWDHRGRLTRVEFRASGGTLTKAVEFDYDVWNRRIAKRVDSNGDGTFETATKYVYDGNDIVLVYDASDSLQNRYLHDPANDVVFADESTVDGLLWALADNQGTVRDWADYAAGTDATTISNHLTYDAFGRIASQSNATHTPLYGFTGQDWDADVGLVYYAADGGGRWYDPTVGRFVSEDPIRTHAGDVNYYRYVGNSPANYTDPTGLTEVPEASFLPAGMTLAQYEASMLRAMLTVPTTGGGSLQSGWLDDYAGWFPDWYTEPVGELIQDGLAIVGIDEIELANASDMELLIGTGIASAALVGTVYGGWTVAHAYLTAPLYHYTTAQGAAGIASSGLISAPVFATNIPPRLMLHPVWGQLTKPFIGWFGPYQNGIKYMPLTAAYQVPKAPMFVHHWIKLFQWKSSVPVAPMLPIPPLP